MNILKGLAALSLLGIIMNSPVMASGLPDELPITWDLSDLYSSPDDSRLKSDIESIKADVEQFVKKFSKLTVSNLSKSIVAYEELSTKLSKIGAYAFLYHTTRLHDKDASSFYQKLSEQLTKDTAPLSFYIVTISSMDYEKISEKMKTDKVLKKYKPLIDDIFKEKDHILTTPEETILHKKSVVGSSLWSKYHEELLSKIDFMIDDKKYNLSEITDMAAHSNDPKKREAASRALSDGLKKNQFAVEKIYNAIILNGIVGRDIRKYKNPEDPRYVSESIKPETAQLLVDVVANNYKALAHRYYKIKAKIMGKSKLQYWDRNAHVGNADDSEIDYKDACKMVLDVFSGFSPTFQSIATDFMTKGWIDVYPNDQKRSGGFCADTTSKNHPYILINFLGKKRDVATLAHELGHGVHMTLSAKQGDLLSGTPLILAETASVFAEKLMNEHLINNAKTKEEKISLLCSCLDDNMNTIVRQIAFFRFEQKVHRARMERELTIDDLNALWRAETELSLGDGVEIDSCVDNYWGYVSHFFGSPFYVFAYSFGALFVESLYYEYKKTGPEFLKKYEEVLSAGGTLRYDEIAAKFGLNPDSKEFWEHAIKSVEQTIDKLEELVDSAPPQSESGSVMSKIKKFFRS